LNTEIICALIAVTGTVVSALISFFVSKSSAEKEIQKMKLEWKRQDIVSSDDDFSDMAIAVSAFIQTQTLRTHTQAVAAIMKIRAKESGDIAKSLDALYEAVGRRGYGYNPDLNQIDNLLSEILEQKRNSKCPQ
jgi:hypothetical protein